MAHELRHAVHNVWKGAAELVLPVRTDSAFAESGVRPARAAPRPPRPPARPRLRGRARPRGGVLAGAAQKKGRRRRRGPRGGGPLRPRGSPRGPEGGQRAREALRPLTRLTGAAAGDPRRC